MTKTRRAEFHGLKSVGNYRGLKTPLFRAGRKSNRIFPTHSGCTSSASSRWNFPGDLILAFAFTRMGSPALVERETNALNSNSASLLLTSRARNNVALGKFSRIKLGTLTRTKPKSFGESLAVSDLEKVRKSVTAEGMLRRNLHVSACDMLSVVPNCTTASRI